jgi:hypothetical protein
MFGSHVSRSIAISFASDKSGKLSGGIHSDVVGNNVIVFTSEILSVCPLAGQYAKTV